MSKETAGVQATPAAPAAKPERKDLPTRQQVFGAAVQDFAAYHGLETPAAEAPDETTVDAPDSESAAEDTATVLSQDESETPAASSEDPAETDTGTDTPEGDGTEEPKPDEGPALTKGMQKRIAKLEEKHQREVEGLKAQLEELKSKQPDPTATAAAPASAPGSYDPIEAQPEVQALRSQEQQHQRTIGSAKKMLADLETQPGKVLEFLKMDDATEAAALLREKLDESQDALSGIRSELAVERSAARKAVSAAKAEVEQVSKKEFPWLSDPKDPRSTIRSAALQQLGAFANHPSAPLFSAVWADWLHRFQGRTPAAKPGAAKAAPPKAVPVRRTAAPPAAQAGGRGGAAGVSETSAGKGTATPQGRRGFFDAVAAQATKNASPR